MKTFLLVLAFVLAFTAPAFAITATPTGTIVQVDYTEPTLNVDGTALVDLNHTSIYYDLGAGPVKAMDVPASSPNGGGAVSRAVTVPVGPNQEVNVRIWATAWDASQESPPSPEVVVRIDRLPPAAPN